MQIPGNVYAIYFVFERDVEKTNEIILLPFRFDLRQNASLITMNAFIPGQATISCKVKILTLKIALVESTGGTISHPSCFPSLPGTLSKSPVWLWVLPVCASVRLRVCASAHLCGPSQRACPVSCCRSGFTQSAGSESLELSSQLEEQRDCNQESPWEGKVVYGRSPLGVLICTRELFWQNHWMGCWSQIPGTSSQDRFSACPQTTETPLPWGNRRAEPGLRGSGAPGVGWNHLLEAKGQGTLSCRNGSK